MFKTQKEEKYRVIVKDMTDELNKISDKKVSKIKIYNFGDSEIGEIINYFSNVLKKNFSNQELKIFYENLESLGIPVITKQMEKYFKKMKFGGGYNHKDNEIYLIKTKKELIFHELFHVATNYCGEDKNKHIGLSIDNIGLGINEGYTDFMVQKYFNSNYKTNYQYYTDIVKIFEQFIGREKMEHFYMTANLNGMIDELNQYTDIKDILQVIKNADELYKLLYLKKEKNEKKDYFKGKLLFEEIYDKLLDMLSQKLKKEFSNGIITKEEAMERYIKFVKENNLETKKYEGQMVNCFNELKYIAFEVDLINMRNKKM